MGLCGVGRAYFSSPAFFDIHVVTTRFAIRGFFGLSPHPCGNQLYFSNPAFTNNVSWYQSIIMLNSLSL